MRIILLLVATSAIFAGCFKKKEIVEQKIIGFANSCEPNQLWLNENLNKEIGKDAHTGTFANVITENDVFGLGLRKNLVELDTLRPVKKIKVACWIKASKLPLTALIVYSIDAGGKNLSWDSKSIKDMVKEANKWVLINQTCEVREIVDKNAKASVYLLNSNKENFMADDMEVFFEMK